MRAAEDILKKAVFPFLQNLSAEDTLQLAVNPKNNVPGVKLAEKILVDPVQ